MDNCTFKYDEDHLIVDSFAIIEGKISSATLRCVWGIYLFALFPEIYDQLHHELVTVFPETKSEKNDNFAFDKARKCHLLKAFIYEVVRTSTFFKIALPRYVKDITGVDIDGYHIPKGTHVLINSYYIDNFSGNYEYPDTIYLKHHLDENNKFKLNKNFASFGIGPRDCVGQSIVIKEMTILFAKIILSGFRFTLLNGDKNEHLLRSQPINRKLSNFSKKEIYNAKVIVYKQQLTTNFQVSA